MLISRASERHIIDQGKFIIRMISPGKKLGDPKDPFGLGPLGRMDHSTLDPGMVIPMHPHMNDEILSYMRKGQMMHRDSHGHIELLYGHYMMMMNAGKVFYHEETCMDDADEKVEMLQIFFRPEEDDLESKVQFHNFEKVLTLRCSSDHKPGSTTPILNTIPSKRHRLKKKDLRDFYMCSMEA
jgi:quercetin 2,3-dioxygenase